MKLLLTFFLLINFTLSAKTFQYTSNSWTLVPGIVEGKDTIPCISLPPVYIITEYNFKTEEEREQWFKIKRRVKKVYPYAVLAELNLREIEHKISLVQKNKDKKKMIEFYENELRVEFEKQIKSLNQEEGKILVKLLNRNTGKTAYDIIKTHRGTFQALCSQGLARLFGQNLKTEYDKVQDIMIERAIGMVERGDF